MYARKTKDHEGTVVLPGSLPPADDQYHFFAGYFYCGLCLPFSNFFVEVMNTYGFRLLDFTPNAVTCLSVFAHLCENFVGIAPNVALFRDFFIPRVEDDALSGNVTCIPRTNLKKHYLDGKLHIKWNEWRADWCWIKQQNFPAFCQLRTEKIEKAANWSIVDPNDVKLGVALYRILALKEAGLTIEMVGADFTCRRIAPLQYRGGRKAWDYKNPADTMRLRPGLNDNLTVMEHYWLICQLFNKGCSFRLPEKVIPLCNNTAKASNLAMMPDCDAKTVLSTWKVPSKKEVENWLAGLKEEAIRVEDDMVHPTKDDEQQYLVARAKEIKKATCSRATKGINIEGRVEEHAEEHAEAPGTNSGRQVKDHAEEQTGEEDQAKESEEDEEQPEESSEEEEEEEAPRPPPAKVKTAIAKKPAQKKAAHTEPTSKELVGIKAAAAASRPQPSRRQPPCGAASRQPASSTVEGEGASQPLAPSRAKRARKTPPPPTPSGAYDTVHWDLSVLSDREEEGE